MYDKLDFTRWGISIHALPEEGDVRYTGLTEEQKQFLSTPSARRATWKACSSEEL